MLDLPEDKGEVLELDIDMVRNGEITDLQQEELDELVLDAAGYRRAEINNGDPADFLREQGVSLHGNEEWLELADMVDDFTSSEASDVNNSGPDGQVSFLIGQGVSEEEILAALAEA